MRKEALLDEVSSVEVVALNLKTHKTADQADREIKKLNNLLRQNKSMTLRIVVALGGHHGQ